ncbi:MAG: hypothetical protein ACLFSQ_08760 [Candidatus Zixiibacteriota bacterium]
MSKIIYEENIYTRLLVIIFGIFIAIFISILIARFFLGVNIDFMVVLVVYAFMILLAFAVVPIRLYTRIDNNGIYIKYGRYEEIIGFNEITSVSLDKRYMSTYSNIGSGYGIDRDKTYLTFMPIWYGRISVKTKQNDFDELVFVSKNSRKVISLIENGIKNNKRDNSQ